MDRVNFTSASLFRPDSSRPFDCRPTYTKIRIAARNRGRGDRVSCASRRYLDIYTIEKTFLSRWRVPIENKAWSLRGKMPTRPSLRARACEPPRFPSLVGVERKGVGASTIMCTTWRRDVLAWAPRGNEQQFVLRETRIKATRFRALVPTFPSPPT